MILFHSKCDYLFLLYNHFQDSKDPILMQLWNERIKPSGIVESDREGLRRVSNLPVTHVYLLFLPCLCSCPIES